MPNNRLVGHSVLVVSDSEKFNEAIKKVLLSLGMNFVEFRKSSSAARQSIFECYYDIVIVNTPLPDEYGVEFALDVTENCDASVLFFDHQESFEETLNRLTERGVLVISRPLSRAKVIGSIKYVTAIQDKIKKIKQQADKAEERFEELKIFDRAKMYLIENKGMSEEDAHRYIVKQAMDSGLSKRRMAEKILED